MVRVAGALALLVALAAGLALLPALRASPERASSERFTPAAEGVTEASHALALPSKRVFRADAEQPLHSVQRAEQPIPAAMSLPPPLLHGAEISGLVLDAAGGPIAGARIRALDLSAKDGAAPAVSLENGEFQLRVPAGPWQLSAEAEGYAPVRRDVFAPAAHVRLLLAPQSLISGRVLRRADRQPVAGVTITATKSDGPPYAVQSTTSGADGAFELRPLLAGTHRLQPLSHEYRGEPMEVQLAAADSVSSIELEVVSATTVTGEIRANGAGCAAGIVELRGPLRFGVPSDPTGRVEILGVLPGSYELVATCPSALPVREQLLVEASSIHRIWELDTGAIVRGSVQTASGKPLPDAVITWTRQEVAQNPGAEPAAPAESSCVSDVHGDFACSGLEPGEYEGALHIGERPQSAAATRLHVPASGDVPRVLLRADASATIRAQVSGDGAARGARMAIFACNSAGAPVLARQEGQSFLLLGLPLGSYALHLGRADCTGEPEARVRLDSDGQIVDVSLVAPRLARLQGRLVDASGAPLPDVWVRITDPVPAWTLLVESAPPVLTGMEGEFSFSGLLPGRYVVQANASGQSATARRELELQPGADVELVLVRPATPADDPSSPSGHDPNHDTK